MTIGASQPDAPFLGRLDELSSLDLRLTAATRNGAQVIVVGGEPGIGKSTLLHTFSRRHADTARQVTVRCSPYDIDGLQPVLRLIDALEPDHRAAAPPPTTVTTGPAAGAPDRAQARAQRAERFISLLDALRHEVGSTTPTIAVIDDIHWGQPLLHDFLAFAVEEILAGRRHHRLLLVLITRLLPPPHPVAALLTDLERHLDVPRIELGPLTTEAIDQIVTAATPNRPSPAYVDLVQRSARGNPLRAQAALQVLARRHVDTGIRPSDPRAWGAIRLPPELADPVTAWIDALPPAVRHTLAAGALWADELTPDDLAPLVPDLTPADLRHHLQTAASTQLLETDGRRYWFSHPSFRDVVLELAPTAELHVFHTRAARRLATATPGARPGTGPAPDDTTARRIGHHLLAAADLVPADEALPHLIQAGHAARRSFSWTESTRYLEAARQLALTTGHGATPAQRAEVLTALGQAYYFDHDVDAALPVLDEAIEVAAEAGDLEHLWADALLTWLRIMMVARTESLTRVPPLERARRFLSTAVDPARRSLIRQALAEQHITAGDFVTGAELAEQALADADESGDPTARAFALYALSFADQADLRLDQALVGMRAAHRQAATADDWWVQDIMQARLALYLLSAGHIDEADNEARSAIASAARRHEHSNQAIGGFVQSAAALARGDFDAFDTLIDHTRREAERSGYVLAELWTAAATVLGHLYRGDPAAADRAADCWASPLPVGLAAFRAAPALLGLPVPLELRRPRRPNQITVGFYAAAVEAAICAGVTDGLDEAARLLAACTGHGFELAAAWPTSLTRIRAELALARGQAGDARALFREAANRATDHGAQLELARTLAGTARLLRLHGDTLGADDDAADATAARARALASLIGLDDRILRLDPLSTPGPSEVGTPAVVLVTDIVGSTELGRQLGDLAWFELVTAHFELVRSSLRRWSGREFSERGDGLLAWFTQVEPALDAALDIQRRSRAAAPTSSNLRVKVSLAAGPTLLRSGRPYGLLPTRACRLLDNARPGEIVVDAAVAAALPPPLTVAERRLIDLRGLGSHTLAVLAPPAS